MINEIVQYQPDSYVSLEVTLGEETVWLSQRQIAELFGTKPQAITRHLKNIYDSWDWIKIQLVPKWNKFKLKAHVLSPLSILPT